MAIQPETTSSDVVMSKARAIYDRRLRPGLEADNMGRLVAIDVDTEDYEVGDEVLEVTDRLRARKPNATIGILRFGDIAVYRIGYFPLGRTLT
jgi:hypothetical protein